MWCGVGWDGVEGACAHRRALQPQAQRANMILPVGAAQTQTQTLYIFTQRTSRQPAVPVVVEMKKTVVVEMKKSADLAGFRLLMNKSAELAVQAEGSPRKMSLTGAG